MATAAEATVRGGGLVSCACLNEHATVNIKKCGFFMAVMCVFMMIGIFTPFITTVAKDMMPPFLPLISNAAGEPPSTGLFAVFMEIGLFFAAFGFLLLFVTINQRNVFQSRLVQKVNVICLVFVFLAWIGLVILACNPIGYTDVPNKFEWLVTVLFEHAFGAGLALVGLAIFQFFFAIMWWYLPDTTKVEKCIKLGFVLSYIILGLISFYPLPAFIMEELDHKPFDFEHMKNVTYSLPRQYSTVHIICAVCEWSICLLSIINLAGYSKALQKVSLRVVVRHKSCLADDAVSLKIIS